LFETPDLGNEDGVMATSQGYGKPAAHRYSPEEKAAAAHSPFRNGTLRIVEDVEWVSAEWIDWYNASRLHSTLGGVPRDEFETTHYVDLETPSHLVLAPT
jgi:hypothetical protein